MLKVLVNAYAVSPDHGSEPGMGWNWCVRLAKECELFIITEGEFREGIERELAVLPQAGNMHFYYLPVSARVRRMCWNQGDWRFYFHYRRWQKRVLSLAREICRTEHIDIIHQLNMVGFREPGFLWRIKGPRFIWGPIGGMALIPTRFFQDASWRERAQIRCKNLVNRIQRKYSLRVIHAIRRAEIVLCATKADRELVSGYHRGKVILINETGTSDLCVSVVRSNPSVHLIWVGRFIPSKQLGLALKAVSLLRDIPVVLEIVGSGEDDQIAYYKALVTQLGIETQVNWHGQVGHEEVGALMDSSDIFVFTSVVEATSTVVMEAISHGLPVVCFDACGFGPLIEPDMGIKIPLSSPEDGIVSFAAAIRHLANQPALRTRMSLACYEKAKELSWNHKIKKVLSLYMAGPA